MKQTLWAVSVFMSTLQRSSSSLLPEYLRLTQSLVEHPVFCNTDPPLYPSLEVTLLRCFKSRRAGPPFSAFPNHAWQVVVFFFLTTSDGLQPNSDGLQPVSHGLLVLFFFLKGRRQELLQLQLRIFFFGTEV